MYINLLNLVVTLLLLVESCCLVSNDASVVLSSPEDGVQEFGGREHTQTVHLGTQL